MTKYLDFFKFVYIFVRLIAHSILFKISFMAVKYSQKAYYGAFISSVFPTEEKFKIYF